MQTDLTCTATVAKTVRLTDSQVTGQPIDIESARRSRLLATVCGTSSQLTSQGTAGATWGVCANDP